MNGQNQDFVNKQGGTRELLKKVVDEDRKLRRQEYISSYAPTGRVAIRKDRKKVRLIRDKKWLNFKNTSAAANFLKVKAYHISTTVNRRGRCRGWYCEYVL